MHQDQSKLLKFFRKNRNGEKIRDHVFTSGEASLSYLKKIYQSQKFYHIGHLEILIYLKILKITNQTK